MLSIQTLKPMSNEQTKSKMKHILPFMLLKWNFVYFLNNNKPKNKKLIKFEEKKTDRIEWIVLCLSAFLKGNKTWAMIVVINYR